jgi:hypothetical protein
LCLSNVVDFYDTETHMSYCLVMFDICMIVALRVDLL